MPRPTTAEISRTKEWDLMNRRYRDLGLCARCASQASYGHQDGFKTSKPPCDPCTPIVATFPKQEAGPWRSNGRRLGRTAPKKRALATAPSQI